jgi:hypothetical protein
MVKHILTGAVALWLASSGVLLGASGGGDREMVFKVMLDDKDIGMHSFRVSREGGREIVDINAEFDITFLAIPFYSYDHVNRETWVDGCLDTIASTTDDNGDDFRVEGRDQGRSFELATRDGQIELDDGCVMTFAYWNRDFLAQPRLLNAQNGEYLAVEVADEGVERIEVGEQQVTSNRYRVRNRERGVDITVWYARDNGQWLSLESRVEGDRVIRYLPVSPANRDPSSRQAASEINARSGTRQ